MAKYCTNCGSTETIKTTTGNEDPTNPNYFFFAAEDDGSCVECYDPLEIWKCVMCGDTFYVSGSGDE